MDICNELTALIHANIDQDYRCIPLANGIVRLVTPIVNHWNDSIELEIRALEDEIIISDRCETTDRLWLQGLEVDESKEKSARAKELAESLGVEYVRGELTRTCGRTDMWMSISAVAQAALRVEGLINTVQPVIRRNFPEEVAGSFAVQRLPFDRNIYYQGAVKRSRVNFVFRNGREKLVNALSSTTKKNAETLAELNAFRFNDIRAIHEDVVPLVVYDLRDNVWTSDTLHIMKAYDILTFGYPAQKIELANTIRAA